MKHRKITVVLLTVQVCQLQMRIEEVTDDPPSRSSLPAAPVADNDSEEESTAIRPLVKVLPAPLVRRAVGA